MYRHIFLIFLFNIVTFSETQWGLYINGSLPDSYGGGVRMLFVQKLDFSLGFSHDIGGVRDFDIEPKGNDDPHGLGWWGKGYSIYGQFAYHFTLPYVKNLTAYPLLTPKFSTFSHPFNSLSPMEKRFFSCKIGAGFEKRLGKRNSHGLAFQLGYHHARIRFNHTDSNKVVRSYESGYTPLFLEGRYTLFFKKREKQRSSSQNHKPTSKTQIQDEINSPHVLSQNIVLAEEKTVVGSNMAIDTLTHDSLNAFPSLWIINFDFDVTQVSNEMTRNIRENVRLLQTMSHVQIIVRGHTDSIGTPEYNKQLSLERAQNVAKALIKEGFDAAQIVRIEGVASQFPKGDNSRESGRRSNRRVEILEYRSSL